ncbi:hypothetical protein CPB86DRAFT_195001 [Serendipita vermifera]|nr:hypothetical protein CPB86DRAFT_195001 [Serendipita vermifera]
MKSCEKRFMWRCQNLPSSDSAMRCSGPFITLEFTVPCQTSPSSDWTPTRPSHRTKGHNCLPIAFFLLFQSHLFYTERSMIALSPDIGTTFAG